jgi:hypothetical protein
MIKYVHTRACKYYIERAYAFAFYRFVVKEEGTVT